jgi:hypothetical protein
MHVMAVRLASKPNRSQRIRSISSLYLTDRLFPLPGAQRELSAPPGATRGSLHFAHTLYLSSKLLKTWAAVAQSV